MIHHAAFRISGFFTATISNSSLGSSTKESNRSMSMLLLRSSPNKSLKIQSFAGDKISVSMIRLYHLLYNDANLQTNGTDVEAGTGTGQYMYQTEPSYLQNTLFKTTMYQ